MAFLDNKNKKINHPTTKKTQWQNLSPRNPDHLKTESQLTCMQKERIPAFLPENVEDLASVLEKISVECHMKELLKFLLCHRCDLIKIDVGFWQIICHFIVLTRRLQFSLPIITWFCTGEERKEIAFKQRIVMSKTLKAFKTLTHFEQQISDWPCNFKRKWAISNKAQFLMKTHLQHFSLFGAGCGQNLEICLLQKQGCFYWEPAFFSVIVF